MALFRLLQTCYLGDALRPAGTVYNFAEGATPPADVAVPYVPPEVAAAPEPSGDALAVQMLVAGLTPAQRALLATAAGVQAPQIPLDPGQRLAAAAAAAGIAAPVFPPADPAVLHSRPPALVLNPAAPPPVASLAPGVVLPVTQPAADDPLAI